MKPIILGFLLFVSLAGCGGGAKPDEKKPAYFKLSFGKASTVEATINPGAPATMKEYKLGLAGALKK